MMNLEQFKKYVEIIIDLNPRGQEMVIDDELRIAKAQKLQREIGASNSLCPLSLEGAEEVILKYGGEKDNEEFLQYAGLLRSAAIAQANDVQKVNAASIQLPDGKEKETERVTWEPEK